MFYNETPNKYTEFQTAKSYGTVKPLDQIRHINTPSAPNVRDLGGWACDGGTVKYGLLFRGGFLSFLDREVLVDELGIRHDLDLRGTSEANITESPLGSDIHYTCATDCNSYSVSDNEAWRINLRCVFDAVTHNEPVYFHCYLGADRTATLACVLEGLLGVSQSDIDKDYELTSFYTGTGTDSQSRRRNESVWMGLINQINSYDGETFRDKCVDFVVRLGFTAEEINDYRRAMIDGNPVDIVPNIKEYTITKLLPANVMLDNTNQNVKQYQKYETNIKCTSGVVIESVKVTMGGVDVTNRVFKGTETNLNRNVTYNLTECTATNRASKVIDSQSYCTEIKASEGHKVESISIKMGGVDVSKYYKDGVIAIPSVTGDLEITVVAVESAPSYTNLLDTAIDFNGNVIGHTPLYSNSRFNGSSGDPVTMDGYNITGLIPAKEGDTIRIRGIKKNDETYQQFKFYKADKQQVKSGYLNFKSTENDGTIINKDLDNGILDYTFGTNLAVSIGASYVAITLYGSLDDVIVTINEEID